MYLLPRVLKEINGRCAILDAVSARHNRPIQSHELRFTIGLSTTEEMEIVLKCVNNSVGR